MSHSAEVYRMFRVFKTLFEMLHDRGYAVQDQDLNLTVDRFKRERCLLEGDGDQAQHRLKARSSLWLLHRKLTTGEGIFVFFPEDPKMGVKPIRAYHDRMVEEKITRAIVVTQQNPTPFAKQAMQALTAGGLHFEQFGENELMVNVTRHELVPKHQPLSDEEKRDFLKKHKLKEKDLPRIQQADPVTCYFGLSKGQVFRITRKSETAGTYITYRMVM
uniref:DNA-directed RNA polymerases I, II, and III subunit RPABC1 n=1 Tax=Eutreptiella gymnastica TaxID=73025 RepID=A0A7S1N9M2_9EUGL|mmetsp:Transcript_143631/g.250698  ORF Transcript_143631/g.250698 Transcript_143631/m.250698 type:complete len:217 (+) Transcript_143631:111-761(+)